MSNTTEATQTKTQAPAVQASSRDSIRGSIFGAKPKSELTDFFGTQIELRQPTMGALLQSQQDGAGDSKLAVARMLIQYAYVPGTGEKVFEEADIESILELPFGPDMQNIQKKINALQGNDVAALLKEVENNTKSD